MCAVVIYISGYAMKRFKSRKSNNTIDTQVEISSSKAESYQSLNPDMSSFSTSKNEVFDSSYRLISTIGRGRSSIVYRAQKISSDSLTDGEQPSVALKVLTLPNKNKGELLQLIRREALAALSAQHKNVIQLYDYVTSGELYYLSLEYAEKGDLRNFLRKNGGKLQIEPAIRLTIEILNGLEAAHKASVLHRDIKPENILLTSDYSVRIADFASALLPSDAINLEELSTGVGTFDYIAPECINARGICESSDLYSVGATLYELISGRLPFAGATVIEIIESKLRDTIVPLRDILPEAPSELEQVLERALNSNPKMRFGNARQFRNSLAAVLEKLDLDHSPTNGLLEPSLNSQLSRAHG